MKICAIGDCHGTTKFLDCYNDILKNHPDCNKIVVLGDHFDPYEPISVEQQIEIYNEFLDVVKSDDRVVSLLGNHDLATYIISNDCTNRTVRYSKYVQMIHEAVMAGLPYSGLAYRVDDYLFSHAGVSNTWFESLKNYYEGYDQRILENYKGWTPEELEDIVAYYPYDYSGYGDDVRQGCTWIRPQSLVSDPLDGFHQIVGHTQVEEIASHGMDNGKNLWLIDNQRKSKYLTLEL